MDEIDEMAELLDTADTEGTADDGVGRDVATLREQLTDLSGQMTAMDGRVTAVSTELANQLTELSRDIDELNRRNEEAAGGSEHGDEGANELDTAELEARLADRLDAAIDDVLGTTEKLAAEQARYEIQFRTDLAELAERLRHPGSA
jgi:chromosome segregation ATPase